MDAGLTGVNLGGGDWHPPAGWASLDRSWGDRPFTLDATTPLPLGDASLDHVYSSMFFEHVDDATAQHLFGEAARVLRRDGLFRVLVPDFETTLDRYRAGNHAFFDGPDGWGIAPRFENWKAHGVEPTLENKLLFVFANYDNKPGDGPRPWERDPSYYCGPPQIGRETVRTAAHRLGALEFSAWAVAKLPAGLAPERIAHLNAYTQEKLRVLAYRAGFKIAEPSYFCGSRSAVMRGPQFDHSPAISLYFEAVR